MRIIPDSIQDYVEILLPRRRESRIHSPCIFPIRTVIGVSAVLISPYGLRACRRIRIIPMPFCPGRWCISAIPVSHEINSITFIVEKGDAVTCVIKQFGEVGIDIPTGCVLFFGDVNNEVFTGLQSSVPIRTCSRDCIVQIPGSVHKPPINERDIFRAAIVDLYPLAGSIAGMMHLVQYHGVG